MLAFVLTRCCLQSFRATLAAKEGTSYLKLLYLCEGRNIRRWTKRIRTLEVIRGLVLLSHSVDLALFHITELRVNTSSSQTFALRPRCFARAPVAHPKLEPQLLWCWSPCYLTMRRPNSPLRAEVNVTDASAHNWNAFNLLFLQRKRRSAPGCSPAPRPSTTASTRGAQQGRPPFFFFFNDPLWWKLYLFTNSVRNKQLLITSFDQVICSLCLSIQTHEKPAMCLRPNLAQLFLSLK